MLTRKMWRISTDRSIRQDKKHRDMEGVGTIMPGNTVLVVMAVENARLREALLEAIAPLNCYPKVMMPAV